MSNQLRTIKKREGGLLWTDHQKLKTPAVIYHRPDKESIHKLKEKIGCFLLCLLAGNTQPSGWEWFEELLRQRWQGVERC